MEQTQTIANDYIQATVSGPVSGQVAVGKYILQVGDVHGGVVNINLPNQKPRLQARPVPVYVLPRHFAGLLDRTEEVGAAERALAADQPVEFYAEGGAGKTTLLRVLARHSLTESYPDGVIYLSARDQAPADLLQSIFDALFEYDAPYKPSEGEMRLALQEKQALIMLDDVGLEREALEYLFDAAPGCTFLLASLERKLWVEGYSAPLPGLPLQEARGLLERQLGRPLESEERDTADRLITALGGNPLAILQLGSLVREGRYSMQDLSKAARESRPDRKIAAFWLEQLTRSERGLIAALAVLNGVPLKAIHLAGMTRQSDVRPELEGLQRRGLVQLSGNGFVLAGGFANFVQEFGNLSQWRALAVRHFRAWGQARLDDPLKILDDADAFLRLASMFKEDGHWQESLELVKIVENALAVGRRWGAWEEALRLGLEAAQALGDLREKAWALHQLGTRALCLGENTAARENLVRALRLRETLGDRVGAAVTRHNLNLLLGPPGHGGDSSPKNPMKPSYYPVHPLAVFTLTALVVSGVLLATAAFALIQASPDVSKVFESIAVALSKPTEAEFPPSTGLVTEEGVIPNTEEALLPALTFTATPTITIPSDLASPTSTPTPTIVLPTDSPVATATGLPLTPVICMRLQGWPVYTVRTGDTLWSIAEATGSSVPELLQANCLSGTRIDAGQPLLVPRLPPTVEPALSDTITLTPIPTTPVPQLPDLIIRSLEVGPATLSSGTTLPIFNIPVLITYANQGEQEAGTFQVGVYLSNVFSDSQEKIQGKVLVFTVESLAPGDSGTYQGLFTLSPSGFDKSLDVLSAWAVADDCSDQKDPAPCEVQESDEGNNRSGDENINFSPLVNIQVPEADATMYYTGTDDTGWYADVSLYGQGLDLEDGQLSGDSLIWDSSQSGDLGTGESLETRLYGPCSGTTHTITLTASDSRGASSTATRQITLENEDSCAPAIYVEAPKSRIYYVSPEKYNSDSEGRRVYEVDIDGVATAFDVLGNEITDSLFWSSDEIGKIGRGGNVTFTLSLTDLDPESCDRTYYTLRIEVTDAEGNSAEESFFILLLESECAPGLIQGP